MTGALTLDGHEYYFRANGAQVKGEFVTENGKISYYTVDNGYKVKDKFFEVNGKWYHADKDGNLATGRQTIDHLNYYSMLMEAKSNLISSLLMEVRHGTTPKIMVKS